MQKILLLILITLLSANFTMAADDAKKKAKQMKTDITNAKLAIKNANNLEKNEATLRSYLADSDYNDNIDIRVLLFDVIKKEYDVYNEKIYLKQQIDTAAFVKTLCRLYVMADHIDSLDVKPNSKGVVNPQYRKKHSTIMAAYYGNLLKGGIFFMTHKKWQDAKDVLTLYLDCKQQPLFSGHQLDGSQDIRVAYFITMASTQTKDYALAMKHADNALKYSAQREATLQELAELCKENNDTANYAKYLREGFLDYHKSEYFFPRLIDYYTERKEYERAYDYANQAVRTDSTNTIFLIAHHSTLMLLNKYEEALKSGEKLLKLSPDLPTPNYNIGYIYYLQAQNELKVKGKPYRTRLKDAQKIYKLSKPYMEKYRKLAPDDKKRWRPVLYDIYLNLNLEKEFNEIEKIAE